MPKTELLISAWELYYSGVFPISANGNSTLPVTDKNSRIIHIQFPRKPQCFYLQIYIPKWTTSPNSYSSKPKVCLISPERLKYLVTDLPVLSPYSLLWKLQTVILVICVRSCDSSAQTLHRFPFHSEKGNFLRKAYMALCSGLRLPVLSLTSLPFCTFHSSPTSPLPVHHTG